MTDPAKDAERLAEIRHREYEFRDKFDRPDYDPLPEQDCEFLIRLLDTAEKKAILLTQERDDAFADHVRVHKDKCAALMPPMRAALAAAADAMGETTGPRRSEDALG